MPAWRARLNWLHYRSLFWRFLLIGLVSLSPIMGALIQFAGDEHEMALRNTRQQAELLVSHAIENHHHLMDEAQSMLGLLASAPEIRRGGSECDTFLARYLTLHRWMSGLKVLSLDGETVCGERPNAGGTAIDRQDYLTKVVTEQRFVVSDMAVDETTGDLTMVGAMPVIASGRVAGVVSVRMRPGLFERHSTQGIGARPDINMLLVDRKRGLVAQFPAVKGPVEPSQESSQIVRKALEIREGSAEARDLKGVQRLFVFRAVPGTDSVLALGLERESVVGSINRALYYRFVLIGLILGGSMLLAGLGAEILIFRPLRSLVHTAGALAHGDFSARSAYVGAGEVGILARALNLMADAVADRERAFKSAKDVAEQALEEAKLANSAKADFLASMSHEIRTPLNGIIGYTERLLDEDLPDHQRRYTELIQVAGSSLLTIANDILDFSSLEADQISLQAEPFSLGALIHDTVSLVTSGAGKEGVPIGVVLDPDTPHLLCGDEARLRQVLLNLLNNAVKFTREGTITVRVEHKSSSPQGEAVRVSVIDTGIGIPSDKHDRLFKRFSQVDRSIRREFGGTGLGLAISKRLIELMGGSIGVESEEGQGSTFWIEVTLPRAEKLADQRLGRQTPVSGTPAEILIVEDIDVNQELARALLVAAGHKVDVASDGEEAIAAVQRKHYDVVLMDIQMPGTDGVTATRRIRALPHPASQVVIIAMTANVLPQQVRSFKAAGMNDCIGKPLKASEVFRTLNVWLPPSMVAEQPKGEQASADEAGLNETAFEDFRNMMGADQVAQWLLRLDQQLAGVFEGDASTAEEREQMARTAHALVSQAALLGFSRLAELCTSFERACHSGEDLELPLKDLRRTAHQVRLMIAERTGPSDGSTTDQGKQAVAESGMAFR